MMSWTRAASQMQKFFRQAVHPRASASGRQRLLAKTSAAGTCGAAVSLVQPHKKHTARCESGVVLIGGVGIVSAALGAAGAALFIKRRCKKEKLCFGIITDVQYADVDQQGNRDYRGVLQVTEDAVAYFNASPEPLAFVTHLGDIVDDRNTSVDDGATTMQALSAVMGRLKGLQTPPVVDKEIKFLKGNHELYNFTPEQMCIGISTEHGTFRCANAAGETYYSFSPVPGWRIVILDPYQESVHAGGRGSLDQEAVRILCERNPNIRAKFEKDGEEVRRLRKIYCNYFEGMDGISQRFCPFNGGLGAQQIGWLHRELGKAVAMGERVLLLCHVLFHPEASRAPAGDEAHCFGKTLVWDFEEVLKILASPEGRCVVGCLHGHQHEGGFHTDEHGIHHIVFEAPLFGPAFCIAELTPNVLTLRGRCCKAVPSLVFPGVGPGRESTRMLQLRPKASAVV